MLGVVRFDARYRVNLTDCVYKVVLQKSIPAQSRQHILDAPPYGSSGGACIEKQTPPLMVHRGELECLSLECETGRGRGAATHPGHVFHDNICIYMYMYTYMCVYI